MATPTPHQLSLLIGHLKLTLLERQHAVSVGIDTSKQDNQITRSLNELRDGISALEQPSDSSLSSIDPSDLAKLQKQYHSLAAQFNASSADTTTATQNETSVESQSTPSNPQQRNPRLSGRGAQRNPSNTTTSTRNVRFRDDPSSEEPAYTDADAQELDLDDAANRAALFGDSKSSNGGETSRYRDDPAPRDQSQLSNQQIYAEHNETLRDQDAQLDVLGQSIRRQRMLGIEMGNELEMQGEMLDDVERGVDRHATSLDRARKRLGDFARKSKANWSWVTIAILVCVLLLVIIVLK